MMSRLSLLCLVLLSLFAVQAIAIPVKKLNNFRSRHHSLAEAVLGSKSTGASPHTLNLSTIISTSGPLDSMSSKFLSSAPTRRGKKLKRDTQPIPSSKYVAAHHMIGNTYPYTLQDWLDDIALAHSSGIDGFALNIGRDEWQPDRVSDAFDAASQFGLDFKLFLSLDMTSMPCETAADAQTLRNLVLKFISRSNYMQVNCQSLVSTFSGESCTFGHKSASDGWSSEFVDHSDLQGKIRFVPSFFIDPSSFGSFNDVMDGDFNWNSGWPIQVTADFVRNLISDAPVKNALSLLATTSFNKIVSAVDLSLSSVKKALGQIIGSPDSDVQHVHSLAALSRNIASRDGASKPTYMAAVSPWFFTHYGADSYDKNFIYLSDQHLYSKRWESLIATRDQVDIVQILTWNDYGESHYIGPIKGAQPNSQAWVDGMDHIGWLDLTSYYAAAFKTGSFPSIEKDKIFMWSRTHPTHATAPDPVGQPTNFELFEDAVWAVVMTTAPSTVILSTSSRNSMTFHVPAGLTKLSIPISAGDEMQGIISRDGNAIVTLHPSNFTFRRNPEVYNFNAFVASASAD
ncbi:hypothetical protein H2248_007423 [Termitomyces sp. 'cryptogamus']|nr:hypothetical protein H2248_007423 [Termitomyces sp. 'cryptogamus']